jgi:hypothetical protein
MQTYNGSCHCGAVKYAVTMEPPTTATSCNCSICRRSGALLAFVPATQFALEQGADALVSYKFNKGHIDHTFCKGCGIKSFASGKMRDGTPTIAVNLRCVDGIDLDALTLKHFDGAKL